MTAFRLQIQGLVKDECQSSCAEAKLDMTGSYYWPPACSRYSDMTAHATGAFAHAGTAPYLDRSVMDIKGTHL